MSLLFRNFIAQNNWIEFNVNYKEKQVNFDDDDQIIKQQPPIFTQRNLQANKKDFNKKLRDFKIFYPKYFKTDA